MEATGGWSEELATDLYAHGHVVSIVNALAIKSFGQSVGVYANGAHIPEQLMGAAGTLAENWLAQLPVKCP